MEPKETVFVISNFADIYDVPKVHQAKTLGLLKTAMHRCAARKVAGFVFNLTRLKIETLYHDDAENLPVAGLGGEPNSGAKGGKKTKVKEIKKAKDPQDGNFDIEDFI